MKEVDLVGLAERTDHQAYLESRARVSLGRVRLFYYREIREETQGEVWFRSGEDRARD